MRHLALAVITFLSAPAPAQKAGAVIQGMKEAQAQSPTAWVLLFQKGNDFFSKLEEDPAWLPRSASKDLIPLEVEPDGWTELASRAVLPPDAVWFAVDPEQQVRIWGLAPMDVNTLIRKCESAGWEARAKGRERFLKENPDHGEALCEELEEAARTEFLRKVLRESKVKLPKDLESSELAFRRLAATLRSLRDLPDWVKSPRPDFALGLVAELNEQEANPGAERMKYEAMLALKDVENQLRKDPGTVRLWRTWSSLAAWVPNASPEALLRSMDPCPGEAWPPQPHPSVVQLLRRRGDWVGLEAFARAGWESFDPTLNQGKSPLPQESRVRIWGLPRLEALVKLGNKDVSLSWLTDIRQVSGSKWHSIKNEITSLLRSDSTHSISDDKFKAVLESEPAVDAASSTPVSAFARIPLEVHLVGWSPKAVREFVSDEHFDLFAKNELVWRSDHGPSKKWFIKMGEEMIAKGDGDDVSPAFVGAQCRAASEPLTMQLGKFLSAHPDSIQGLKTRVRLLTVRLPHPRLEAIVRADSEILELPPLKRTEWVPNAELWKLSAKKLLPKIEKQLKLFPSDRSLWRTWVGWIKYSPKPVSPAEFAKSIPVYGSRRAWMQAIPTEVVEEICADLEQKRDWEELAKWSEARLSQPNPGPDAKLDSFSEYFRKAREAGKLTVQ